MTDSISFCKKDGEPFTEEEQLSLLAELNSIMPEFMIFEDDGYYDICIALKAKNYLLYNKIKNKKTIKGSAFKTSSKEPILKQLMEDIIQALLDEKIESLPSIYERYCDLARNVTDIQPWCQKKTITKSVLKCVGHKDMLDTEKKEKKIRKNESDVLDALNGRKVQEGDKVYIYPKVVETITEDIPKYKRNKKTDELELIGYKTKTTVITGLGHAEDFDGKYCIDKLLKRCYDTVNIFKNIIDMNKFVKHKE